MQDQKIIFAGTPEFAAVGLQALLAQNYTISAVYTQPDRRAGRGRKLQASAVKQLAQAHQIPVFQPHSLKKEIVQQELAALQPDLLIVAAYGLLLPQAVLNIPRLGCINIHASLLPRWRGAAPIQRAIAAGDTQTGITIMQMDAGLDTGDMLLSKTCAILPTDTAATLHDRLAILGGESIVQALANWAQLVPQAQDEALACYARKLDKSEAQLDWQQPAQVLERSIRALNPWPIAVASLRELSLRIWGAEAQIAEQTTYPPGTLLRADKNGLAVQTGQGVLRLLQVQQPGAKPVSAHDFLNAHPDWRT